MTLAADAIDRRRSPSGLADGHHTVLLPVRKHLQQHPWSCGPATLRVVLGSLGIDLEERKLATMAGCTPERGTQPAGLVRALTRLGVHHEVVEPGSLGHIEDRLHAFEYIIVDYQAWGRRGRDYQQLRSGHYSVVFGCNTSHLFLADPAKKPVRSGDPWGARGVRKDLFVRRWRDRGPNDLHTHRWMLCVPIAQSHR